MPDLTSSIVGGTLGDVGIKETLLSEVSPLHDQRKGGFGHDLSFSDEAGVPLRTKTSEFEAEPVCRGVGSGNEGGEPSISWSDPW